MILRQFYDGDDGNKCGQPLERRGPASPLRLDGAKLSNMSGFSLGEALGSPGSEPAQIHSNLSEKRHPDRALEVVKGNGEGAASLSSGNPTARSAPDRRDCRSSLSRIGAPAAFAVFAANYQPVPSSSPQKSWGSSGVAHEKNSG
jgi:hypothetical protein